MLIAAVKTVLVSGMCSRYLLYKLRDTEQVEIENVTVNTSGILKYMYNPSSAFGLSYSIDSICNASLAQLLLWSRVRVSGSKITVL